MKKDGDRRGKESEHCLPFLFLITTQRIFCIAVGGELGGVGVDEAVEINCQVMIGVDGGEEVEGGVDGVVGVEVLSFRPPFLRSILVLSCFFSRSVFIHCVAWRGGCSALATSLVLALVL